MGGRLDRKRADGEGVRGLRGKLEREALGSVARRVEWGGAHERSQHTVQGEQNRTDNGRTSLEGS